MQPREFFFDDFLSISGKDFLVFNYQKYGVSKNRLLRDRETQ